MKILRNSSTEHVATSILKQHNNILRFRKYQKQCSDFLTHSLGSFLFALTLHSLFSLHSGSDIPGMHLWGGISVRILTPHPEWSSVELDPSIRTGFPRQSWVSQITEKAQGHKGTQCWSYFWKQHLSSQGWLQRYSKFVNTCSDTRAAFKRG